MTGTAKFSECGRYRWELTRTWDELLPWMCVIGLNPSKATATESDHTITKLIEFGKRWGHGSLLMQNIFAYVSTDPKGLKNPLDPVGAENLIDHIAARIQQRGCTLVVAAWGRHGGGRGELVRHRIPGMMCFGLNKSDLSPTHPLMLSYNTELVQYT